MASHTATPAPTTSTRPFTGAEYLESLRGPREIWIYGERVKDLTTHPAFRNAARMLARLYDALHDPAYHAILTCDTDTGSGGYTHKYFRAPASADDLVGARDAIAAWARLTYGWMGRSPDYKAAFLATLGANADFYAPYQDNARRWYREAQERVLFMNHALAHPPVDRHRPPDEVADVYVHVEKETDAGLIVSGAKVVATGSALTHYNFIAHIGSAGLSPIQNKAFGPVFIAPMDTPGVKLICRPSYALAAEVVGSPFDYPLSSRLDENDAILVFDHALIPWENVLIYADLEKSNTFFPHSGFLPRAMLQGCTRLAVKLDFIAGLLLKAVAVTGTKDFYGVQAAVGEVLAWRHLFWGLTEAMARAPIPWAGDAVLPNPEYAAAYRVFATVAYPRIKEIIENTVTSGLIYIPAHAVDFQTPELRPYLDKYMRGSDGSTALERVKLMKLLWDAMGTEFGGRHELYERNYAGPNDGIRVHTLQGAMATGLADRCIGFAEQCMAEYDLEGWTVPDLITPDDVNLFLKKSR
jgi:4-hydroxyphenylacetate 3-monooxygenase